MGIKHTRCYQCKEKPKKGVTILHTLVWLFMMAMPFKETTKQCQVLIFKINHEFHHLIFLFYWIVTPVNTMLASIDDVLNKNSFQPTRVSYQKAKV